jgi:ATP-dependent protease Clp ATPase subunit
MKNRAPQAQSCSFCGKSQDEVERMVTSKVGHICDDCVDICVSVRSGVSIPGWAVTTLETAECSICGHRPPRGVTIISKQTSAICENCVIAVREVLEEDAAQHNR